MADSNQNSVLGNVEVRGEPQIAPIGVDEFEAVRITDSQRVHSCGLDHFIVELRPETADPDLMQAMV